MTYLPTPIKSIQYGTISLSSGNTTATATITSVVTNNCLLHLLGFTDDATGTSLASFNANSVWPRIDLTNATTVTATLANSSSANFTINFVVVEYQPVFIKTARQSGTISFTGTSGTASISSVNTAKALIGYEGFAIDTNTLISSLEMAQVFPALTLTNSTTITATIGQAVTTARVNFNIIEFH